MLAIHDRDRDALDALVAPEYVLRGSPDVPREEWLKNARALCWGQAHIADFRVRQQEATAVVSFLLTFDQGPATCQPALLRSLITDVWHQRDGRWQLAVRHSGPPGEGRGVAAQFSVVPRVPPVFEAKAELSMVSTRRNTSTWTLGAAADAIHRGRRSVGTVGPTSYNGGSVNLPGGLGGHRRAGQLERPFIAPIVRAARSTRSIRPRTTSTGLPIRSTGGISIICARAWNSRHSVDGR